MAISLPKFLKNLSTNHVLGLLAVVVLGYVLYTYSLRKGSSKDSMKDAAAAGGVDPGPGGDCWPACARAGCGHEDLHPVRGPGNRRRRARDHRLLIPRTAAPASAPPLPHDSYPPHPLTTPRIHVSSPVPTARWAPVAGCAGRSGCDSRRARGSPVLLRRGHTGGGDGTVRARGRVRAECDVQD